VPFKTSAENIFDQVGSYLTPSESKGVQQFLKGTREPVGFSASVLSSFHGWSSGSIKHKEYMYWNCKDGRESRKQRAELGVWSCTCVIELKDWAD
jgi:hypothetical protein